MDSTAKSKRCRYPLSSTLFVKRAEHREFHAQLVAVEYGDSGETSGKGLCPSQLHVFKADHDLSRSLQAPQFSLSLESAEVVLIKPRKETGQSCRSIETSRSFCVTTQAGICYQFRAQDDFECQLWINMLKFLIIFPYSNVPQDPRCDTSMFDKKTDARQYGADSSWPVYVAPEEVGGRCRLAGMQVLTLKGIEKGHTQQQGEMKIYSLSDDRHPLLSLKHSTIRCTGKMGRWLYIEMGSRCKGGPGLLWMHFGSKEKAVLMKEVFYLFLVKQQVSSQCLQQQSPQRHFPLAPAPKGPPNSPRPLSMPAAYSPKASPLLTPGTSSSKKRFIPPSPHASPRQSHSYEPMETYALPSQKLEHSYAVLECPNPNLPEQDVCEDHDYEVLESASKHEYAIVNKKRK